MAEKDIDGKDEMIGIKHRRKTGSSSFVPRYLLHINTGLRAKII